MKRFFQPTKGGRLQNNQAAQPAPAPGAPTQGVGGKGQRRAMRTGGKGATRSGGNLMQPHTSPLNQPATGQFGAGVGENQRPNVM